MQQDYLYMFQACIALGAFSAVFLVFRYQVIDKYVDNRKEALRTMVDINDNKEWAIWIQEVGKKDIGKPNYDEMLIKAEPWTKTFVEEIQKYRETRKELVDDGNWVITGWVILAIVYLLAQTFSLYQYIAYLFLMLVFLVPLWRTCVFFRGALVDRC